MILLGWFAVVGLGWLQFMLRTPADQGRLFFPRSFRWPWRGLFWKPLAATLDTTCRHRAGALTSVYSLAVVIPSALRLAAARGRVRQSHLS